MHNRLSIGDRMIKWGGLVNSACSLCNEPLETNGHMFFECSFSAEVLKNFVRGVMGNDYTRVWSEVVSLISGSEQDTMQNFTFRYVFQSTIHVIWTERNGGKHEEKLLPPAMLIRFIDMNIRNRFISVQRAGVARLAGDLRYWFSTRPISDRRKYRSNIIYNFYFFI